MVFAAAEHVGVRVEDDTELDSFISDVQLRLFPYASPEWARRFPRVFSGLTANRLAVVTPRAPEPAPSRASPAESATNVRGFPDLSRDVDAELAALHTQVRRRPSPFVEQDEPVGSPSLSIAPPPSTEPSGRSAESRAGSAAPSPPISSVHPGERASADEVALALAPAPSSSAIPARRRPARKAAVAAAASLAVRDSRSTCYSPTNSPHRSPPAPRRPVPNGLVRPMRVTRSRPSSTTASAGTALVPRSSVTCSTIRRALAFGAPTRIGSVFVGKRRLGVGLRVRSRSRRMTPVPLHLNSLRILRSGSKAQPPLFCLVAMLPSMAS